MFHFTLTFKLKPSNCHTNELLFHFACETNGFYRLLLATHILYTQLLCSIKFIEFANDKNIMQFSFISHVIVHSVDLLSLPIFLPIQFHLCMSLYNTRLLYIFFAQIFMSVCGEIVCTL